MEAPPPVIVNPSTAALVWLSPKQRVDPFPSTVVNSGPLTLATVIPLLMEISAESTYVPLVTSTVSPSDATSAAD
jgi:hypothetical protein